MSSRGFCKSHQVKCVLNDDMTRSYENILDADALIRGFPIYFFDISAQAKAVIDRLYAFFGEELLKDNLLSKKLSIIAFNSVMTPEMVLHH